MIEIDDSGCPRHVGLFVGPEDPSLCIAGVEGEIVGTAECHRSGNIESLIGDRERADKVPGLDTIDRRDPTAHLSGLNHQPRNLLGFHDLRVRTRSVQLPVSLIHEPETGPDVDRRDTTGMDRGRAGDTRVRLIHPHDDRLDLRFAQRAGCSPAIDRPCVLGTFVILNPGVGAGECNRRARKVHASRDRKRVRVILVESTLASDRVPGSRCVERNIADQSRLGCLVADADVRGLIPLGNDPGLIGDADIHIGTHDVGGERDRSREVLRAQLDAGHRSRAAIQFDRPVAIVGERVLASENDLGRTIEFDATLPIHRCRETQGDDPGSDFAVHTLGGPEGTLGRRRPFDGVLRRSIPGRVLPRPEYGNSRHGQSDRNDDCHK
ncbi:unannotated protein [freshwater metagenome]|uniref:Unannotated protein n=1 Tax=freshwater metagenome TaxID=449393 RepID=A0A6J6IWH3_9ZZZZ